MLTFINAFCVARQKMQHRQLTELLTGTFVLPGSGKPVNRDLRQQHVLSCAEQTARMSAR
jgi:hypothetical protein